MSILTGLLRDQVTLASRIELERLTLTTSRFSTGSASICVQGKIGMSFQLYSSDSRSNQNAGPRRDKQGNLLSLDGRLDNFDEIAEELGLDRFGISDIEVMLAAFERWGSECFARFTGDWAVAAWCERTQELVLARDHAGSRTLFYQRQPHRILWSTYLEPFLDDQSATRLSKEYATRYLACLPIGDLTPYEGLCSVLPGHYIVFSKSGIAQRAHWSPANAGRIRYQTDADYEGHFLHAFRRSVARRTGHGAPILAQLSGGMDSTSIVCMSDQIRRRSDPSAEILDTLSYFDDSEASLDERAFFSITEKRRGKSGTHINAAFAERTFSLPSTIDEIYVVPGADSFSIAQERRLFDVFKRGGYRSILSGIGGDEILGGIPDGLPELASYLVRGDLARWLRQSLSWSLIDHSPLVGTLSNSVRYVSRLYLPRESQARKLPPWLSDTIDIDSRFKAILPARIKRWGMSPDELDNLSSWWSIIETLPHTIPQALFRPEYRYPMLDKDLVNYVFGIPREQLVRPGRRRSLMRRAMRGIVPIEILERKRKAYQLRAPLNAIAQAHSKLQSLFGNSVMSELGLVDHGQLLTELSRTAAGDAQWHQAILRAAAYELWLQSIHRLGNSRQSSNVPRTAEPSLA